MRLLVGHDAQVGEWIGEQLGVTMVPPFAAIGILDHFGALSGAWLVNGFNHFNADLTIYGPGMLTRRTIRACYSHLFIDLGVIRVTGRTRRDNQTMRDMFPRLGFQFECVQRRFYGPRRRDDAFVFALFQSCAEKWITS